MSRVKSAVDPRGYKEILQTICTELAKVNRREVDLNEETDITADLEVDSVAVMDLLFLLEERYDISVPLNDLGEARTIGDLSTLIHRIAAEG